MNNSPPKLTLREAAEMAANVLENLGYDPVDLREALAEQAEREPVAIDWDKAHEVLCDVWSRVISADDGFDAIQDLIYAAPVRTKDLTDDDLRICFKSTNTSEPLVEGWSGLERFARAVIAADREKNK